MPWILARHFPTRKPEVDEYCGSYFSRDWGPYSLFPTIGILREPWALYSHHTEPLPAGRLHHHPAFEAINHLSTQLLQARHLGGNVIGFNVDMNPALMFD